MDTRWIERLERLATASARARDERLRRLTVEEGLRLLEDLCRGIPEFDRPPAHKSHPIGLCKWWKKRD